MLVGFFWFLFCVYFLLPPSCPLDFSLNAVSAAVSSAPRKVQSEHSRLNSSLNFPFHSLLGTTLASADISTSHAGLALFVPHDLILTVSQYLVPCGGGENPIIINLIVG